MKEINIEEWHKIGNKITKELGICECQRKISSIVKALLNIKEKILNQNLKFSAYEIIIIAVLDSRELLTHGTNIEYPILNEEHQFWMWLESVKNNPNLEDN